MMSSTLTINPEEGNGVTDPNSEIVTNVASVQNADELYELWSNEIEEDNNISRAQQSATELQSLYYRSWHAQ